MAIMGNEVSSALRSFHYHLCDYSEDPEMNDGKAMEDSGADVRDKETDYGAPASGATGWGNDFTSVDLSTMLSLGKGPGGQDPEVEGISSRINGIRSAMQTPGYADIYTQKPVAADLHPLKGANGDHPYPIGALEEFGIDKCPQGGTIAPPVSSHQTQPLKRGSSGSAPMILHFTARPHPGSDLENSASVPIPHFHVPTALTDEDELNPLDGTGTQEYHQIQQSVPQSKQQQEVPPRVFPPQMPYVLDAQQQQASLQKAAQAAFCDRMPSQHFQPRKMAGTQVSTFGGVPLHSSEADELPNGVSRSQDGKKGKYPDLGFGGRVHNRRFSARQAPSVPMDPDGVSDSTHGPSSIDGVRQHRQPFPSWATQHLYDSNAFQGGPLHMHDMNLRPAKGPIDWRLKTIDSSPISPRRFSVPASFLESPKETNDTPDMSSDHDYDNLRGNFNIDELVSSIQSLRMDRDPKNHHHPQHDSQNIHRPGRFNTRNIQMVPDINKSTGIPPQDIFRSHQQPNTILSQHGYPDPVQMQPHQPSSKLGDYFQCAAPSNMVIPRLDESLRRHSVGSGAVSIAIPKSTHSSFYKNNIYNQGDTPISRQSVHVDHEENEPSWRRKSTPHYNVLRKPNIQWTFPEENELSRDMHFYPHLYVIEFKNGRMNFFFIDPSTDFSVKPGDLVIVEADRGMDLGKVTASDIRTTRELYKYKNRYLESSSNAIYDPDTGCVIRQSKHIYPKCIYRLASPSEVSQFSSKLLDEESAVQVCKLKVKKKNLPMNIVDAEYQWDRKKLTFYFTSENRIDFRGLVRELFKLYKTRIWMCAVLGKSANTRAEGSVDDSSTHISRNTGYCTDQN